MNVIFLLAPQLGLRSIRVRKLAYRCQHMYLFISFTIGIRRLKFELLSWNIMIYTLIIIIYKLECVIYEEVCCLKCQCVTYLRCGDEVDYALTALTVERH